MKKRSILTSILVAGAFALFAPATPASAGTTSVAVPVSCNFGGSTTFNTTAHVTVTAPNNALPLLPYQARFLVHLDGIVATFNVKTFAMNSTYSVTGPVTPHGTLTYTETQRPIPAGTEPVSQTFTQTFTPGLFGGPVTYTFTGVSYDFAYYTTDNIHAACTLLNGPVVVGHTNVL
jgi:hypothetical protein